MGMRDLDRHPLTPAEQARIERIEAALRKRHEDARKELRRLHWLSACGKAKPLTFIEKMRQLGEP